MISFLSMISLALTIVLVFSIPVVTLIVFRKKANIFKNLTAGALGMFLSKYLIQVPLLSVFYSTHLGSQLLTQPFGNVLFIAATSALTLILGLSIMYAILFVSKTQGHSEITLGVIGFASFEAIFLVGYLYIQYLLIAINVNNGSLDVVVYADFIRLLNQTNPLILIFDGIEQWLLAAIHIATAHIMFYQWQKKNILKGIATSFVIYGSFYYFVTYSQIIATFYTMTKLPIFFWGGWALWFLFQEWQFNRKAQ